MLSRLHRRGARATRLFLWLADRAATPVHSRGPSGGSVLRACRLLEWPVCGGRTGVAALARRGGGEGRAYWPLAVPVPPECLRRHRSKGPAELLEGRFH